MEKYYLTLSNDRKVRLDYTSHAAREFMKRKCNKLRKYDALELRFIMWYFATDGEKADGKDLELSEVEFGRLIDMSAILEFNRIVKRMLLWTRN